MKTFEAFVVVSCVVALVQSAAITQEMKDQFMAIAKECQSKTGASDDDLMNLAKYQPTGTKAGKCLNACIMQKVNTLGDNGKFKKDGAMLISMAVTKNDPAEMKIAEEIIDACAGIAVSDDVCEASEQYSVCFQKEYNGRGLEHLPLV